MKRNSRASLLSPAYSSTLAGTAPRATTLPLRPNHCPWQSGFSILDLSCTDRVGIKSSIPANRTKEMMGRSGFVIDSEEIAAGQGFVSIETTANSSLARGADSAAQLLNVAGNSGCAITLSKWICKGKRLSRYRIRQKRVQSLKDLYRLQAARNMCKRTVITHKKACRYII